MRIVGKSNTCFAILQEAQKKSREELKLFAASQRTRPRERAITGEYEKKLRYRGGVGDNRTEAILDKGGAVSG